MSREQIAAGVEQGNRDWADQSARWRKAGKRRGGLYKPWEED